jgi:hypothetical protein
VKPAFLTAIALCLTVVAASAADKPNFSGEWKMNPTKSVYGDIPMPTSFVRKITLKETSLAIVDEQTRESGTQTTSRTMTTDSTPAPQNVNGNQVTCSATWDGMALVVTTVADSVAVTFKDHMKLSADGKTLISEVQITAPQGEAAVLIAFDRQ